MLRFLQDQFSSGTFWLVWAPLAVALLVAATWMRERKQSAGRPLAGGERHTTLR